MTVHFSRAARGVMRLVRKRQSPCAGWITGTVLGHTWIVDNLVLRDSAYPPSHEETATAVETWKEELIGSFSAFQENPDPAVSFAGLIIRIFSHHLEAMESEGVSRQPFIRIHEEE
ncbi:MAG: hypothetical protein JXA62_09620 [Candidatus Aminicenantes bacterium]|nr:hypothetical protein [Candidatus Aminicenantes bacterium]